MEFSFGLFYINYIILLSIPTFFHQLRSEKSEYFWLKFIISLTILFFISLFLPYAKHNDDTFIDLIYNTLVMVFLFGLLGVISLICYQHSRVLLRCIYGLVTYLIAYSWFAVFENLFRFPYFSLYYFLLELGVYGTIYTIFFLGSHFKIYSSSFGISRTARKILVFILIICTSFLLISGEFIPLKYSESLRVMCGVILSYTIFIILNMYNDEKMLHENYLLLNQTIEKEKEQYKLSKEYIDIINIKCHDLRKQIEYLGKNKNVSNKEIDYEKQQIMEAISLYDSKINSGNEALDIVLSEKQRRCVKNHIEITTIADGSKLSFMHRTDIYSLMNNILSNAIEATMYLEEEKRFISVSIKEEIGMIHINVNNSYDGKIYIVNDKFISRKRNKNNHGFGTLSIKMIVEKYKGTLNFKSNDNFFSVDILIPIEASKIQD